MIAMLAINGVPESLASTLLASITSTSTALHEQEHEHEQEQEHEHEHEEMPEQRDYGCHAPRRTTHMELSQGWRAA